MLAGTVAMAQQQPGGQQQQQAEILGKLIDDQTGKPVEYASVALLKSTDSSVVTGMLSKGNGDFDFRNIAPGKYILKIYFIGYETFFKPVTVRQSSDVGNIRENYCHRAERRGSGRREACYDHGDRQTRV